jgi:putative transposase
MRPSGPHPRGRPAQNAGLLRLIQAKREQCWRPSAEELRKGFRGWHQRGYLPHFDAPGVTQFVTFMLAESFPVERRREWEPIFKEEDDHLRRAKLESWLDRGYGPCWLRNEAVAECVQTNLLDGNRQAFELKAWAIMPNHVHLVVDIWDESPLAVLMNRWKGRSSRAANKLLERSGTFWQEDYFDTVIRDEEHLRRAIRYTELNPPKAALVKEAADWRWSSARFRDQYARLAVTTERGA